MKKKLLTLLLAASMTLGSVGGAWAAEPARLSSVSLQDWLQNALTKYFEQIIVQRPAVPDAPEQDGSGIPNAPEQNGSRQAAQVVNLVNQQRSARGLQVLKSDSRLARLAQLKAEDMAKKGYFSHTSPTYGSAFDMMKAAGYSYRTAGENIAKGQKTAETVMRGWMNSSGHRANILSTGYKKIGVGYALDASGTPHWVQIFAG